MTKNQDDIFSALVGGDVKPIAAKKRVLVEKKKESKAKDASQSVRRKAAIDAKVDDLDPLSSEPVDMVSPMALLSYCRPGVQHGVFKSLRLGKYIIDARLDLHRLTVNEARVTLYGFVKDCLLFVNKETQYQAGVTPLSLLWKDPHCSAYFIESRSASGEQVATLVVSPHAIHRLLVMSRPFF